MKQNTKKKRRKGNKVINTLSTKRARLKTKQVTPFV